MGTAAHPARDVPATPRPAHTREGEAPAEPYVHPTQRQCPILERRKGGARKTTIRRHQSVPQPEDRETHVGKTALAATNTSGYIIHISITSDGYEMNRADMSWTTKDFDSRTMKGPAGSYRGKEFAFAGLCRAYSCCSAATER
jgi:hypothetical protein